MVDWKGRFPRTVGALLLLGAAVAAPFAGGLLSGEKLGGRDTFRLYAPLRPLVVESLRSFSLPLWNPHEGTGHPLLAEGIHGVLHPVSVAMAWVAPRSTNVLLLAYLVAAAAGALLLARELGRSWAAAFLAAVSYALSGFVASMTDNLVFLAGAATLPWVVAALRGCSRPGALPVAGAGAAVAAGLLAGDPQALGVGVLLGGALAVEAGGLRALGRVAGGILLGALVGAVQLVPSAVHVSRTVRKFALDESARGQWALSPWRLVELAVPGYFTPRESTLRAPVFQALGGTSGFTLPFARSVHVGAALLLLALRGIRADRTGRLLAAAAAILLWLALGPALGADGATGWIPVWGQFRYAEKLVGPLTLALVLLAASGLDRELAGERRSWLPPALLVAGLGSAVLLLPFVPSRALAAGALLAAPSALALGALLWARRAPVVPRAWLAAGLAWATAAAAVPWAVDWLPARCPDDGLLPALRAEPPGPRIATPTARERDPALPGAFERTWCQYAALGVAALNAAVPVDQIDVYTGLDPLRFAKVFENLGPERWAGLRRYGITHVVAGRPVDAEDVALLGSATAGGRVVAGSADGWFTAWAVPHRPWASFAPAVSAFDSPQPTLERLLELERTRSAGVVVQAPSAPPVAPGSVSAVRRGVDWLEVDAEASGDGILVVNDAFWPGWVARVDGVETPVLPADVLVRAVRFPAGRHRLRMTYEPPEVAWGLALTAAGLAMAVALAGLGLRGRRTAAAALQK